MSFLKDLLILLCTVVVFEASGQNLSLPLDNQGYHIVDRLQILSDSTTGYHSAIKPLLRADIIELGIKLQDAGLSKSDYSDIRYLFDDNNEFVMPIAGDDIAGAQYIDSTRTFYVGVSPREFEDFYTTSKRAVFNTFYKTPANFFQVDTRDFYLRVNPIIDFSLGRENEEEVTLFYNKRGVSIRGGIGHKVYFSTQIIEHQARFPNYYQEFETQFKAIAGIAFYKNYRSSIFDLPGSKDYLLADGYVGFDLTKHIGVQFGHGRNFLGNGIRSLLISDFSPEYFYLKINTRVWKLHYQNLFAEMTAEGTFDRPGENVLRKKYLAAHYLSFKPSSRLEFGVYEAVVHFRENGGFELQYLNPVIFYRTIEGNLGSPDNAILGANARWDFLNRFSLYGQFILDDIHIKNILDGKLGWWGNKFGIQAGLKYINAFTIDHLDLQLEYNSVRPFTYSHKDSTSSYSHFNQALAHPNGANFKELILSARYQPLPKLTLKILAVLLNTGEDPEGENFGSNINKENITRIGDFGMFVGQGIETDVSTFTFEANYMLKHNLWFDLRFFSRSKVTALPEPDKNTMYIMGGVRLNIGSEVGVF